MRGKGVQQPVTVLRGQPGARKRLPRAPGGTLAEAGMRRDWVEISSLRGAHVLLTLPCDGAASAGNYFRANVSRETGRTTWREADALLRDLRHAGRVALAAVDSAILETQPKDARGAIVLETEMHRASNPEGADRGAPSWRRYRPTPGGRLGRLEALTESLVKAVRRVESLGIPHIFALVNPRADFLALAAAVEHCGLMDRWVLFRPPAHPRHLLRAVRNVVPIVCAATACQALPGGIYPIPALSSHLLGESRRYRHPLPPPWNRHDRLPSLKTIEARWRALLRRCRTPM